MSGEKPRWLVTCSCGYERECLSIWAATATAKLHVEHLGDKAVPHHITIKDQSLPPRSVDRTSPAPYHPYRTSTNGGCLDFRGLEHLKGQACE